jgi:hypothetical protein
MRWQGVIALLSVVAVNNTRADINGLPIHGFLDVGYDYTSQSVADRRDQGFVLGNLDLYLTPQFSGHVRSLIELAFEYGEDGSLATDLERMQLGYTVSDDLTLWMGRFHTPYGFWNTAYHHGAQIQPSVARPRFIAFEDQGGILPSHTVGAWATGRHALASGHVKYDVYIGNGSRIVDGTLDPNTVRDDNGSMAVGGHVAYQFGVAMRGMIVGLHALSERVPCYVSGVLVAEPRLTVFGAYAAYEGDRWEQDTEYYRFSNKDDDATRSSWAGFAQLGYRVTDIVIPYIRYEQAVLDQNDAYFSTQASGRSYRRAMVGVRYEIDPAAVLKLELDRTDESRDGGSKYNDARVQFAVRF